MIGLGLGLSKGSFVPSADVVSFDSDYQAVLTKASDLGYTAPSAASKTLQNTLVTDLKTAGVWDKLDLLYVFAFESGDSDFATLNWKAPNNFQLTKTNSPTFTEKEGFAQSGTASLDTGFVLDTVDASRNFARTDAGIFVAFPTLSTTTIANNRPFGTTNIVNYLTSRIDVDGVNGNNRIWFNSSSKHDSYNVEKKDNSIHFYNRTSQTNVDERNTDLLNDTTNVSAATDVPTTALINEELVLLRYASGYLETTANMGIFALGSSLTTAEMQAVETAWYTNYFTSL